MTKTRVVVVDDSALVRSMLKEIINREPDMECAGTAADPLLAREMIRDLNPDVITLDVEMPRMDGLDFLSRLMRLRPMPVVMVSTLTERGAETTLRALELGAVDFVAKPKMGVSDGLRALSDDITDKIRVAARAKVRRLAPADLAAAGLAARTALAQGGKTLRGGKIGTATPAASATTTTTLTAAQRADLGPLASEPIIFIGASTGGTEATREVLIQLPHDAPALMITQHMPAGFTKSYANRLNGLCRISVKEAVDGEPVLRGHAYIAPGGLHMAVERAGTTHVVRVFDADPVNRHRPSVEVLFKSAARAVGANAVGIMLTGMGADGAAAMREMRDAGSHNLVQDEASCVVFGMPREAIAAGAAHEVLPLSHIAQRLIERLRGTAGGVRHRV